MCLQITKIKNLKFHKPKSPLEKWIKLSRHTRLEEELEDDHLCDLKFQSFYLVKGLGKDCSSFLSSVTQDYEFGK